SLTRNPIHNRTHNLIPSQTPSPIHNLILSRILSRILSPTLILSRHPVRASPVLQAHRADEPPLKARIMTKAGKLSRPFLVQAPRQCAPAAATPPRRRGRCA